jgi:DNA polymerase elongation subunit (family B)
MDTIVFDIEVAGLPWAEVDQATRDYLLTRAGDEAEREAVPERLALYPGLGQVIAIGLWNLEADRGMMLLDGQSAAEHEWERVPRATLFRGGEAELLQRFWDVLERKRPRLVSFNGRGYDGPMLMIRSAQLGVACSRNLVPNRYSIAEHCDLSDVLSFMGARREMYRLDYWCRRFGVESPKGGLDGSQVGRAYREGRIEEIGEYCLRDVRATGELYRKLEHSLLPLFSGGPRRA